MPTAEPLFCFTSNRIEIHPCLNCRAPMTLISGNSSHSSSDVRNFHCLNCDSADMNSLHRPGLDVSV
jgi:hypothetical protein